MDNLRMTLRILFREIDGEEVLARIATSASGAAFRRPFDRPLDADSFKRHFRERAESYSLEQLDAVCRMLESSWAKNDGSTPGCTGRASVFNCLLVFCREALCLQGNDPVCRYPFLMRWHEVATYLGENLLTAAFLAASDLEDSFERRSFAWKSVIDHDNRLLNACFARRMADLHFHLQGSSQVFALNWLELMNAIGHREAAFETLSEFQAPRLRHTDRSRQDRPEGESLYLCAIKACAIRCVLFVSLLERHGACVDSEKDRELLRHILRCERVDEAYLFLPELDGRIAALGLCLGRRYDGAVVDYAIPRSLPDRDLADPARYNRSVLVGERKFLYDAFRAIFSREWNDTYAALFYAYLLFKARIRSEFVQSNGKAGFENFNLYDSRKKTFVRRNTIYERLLPRLAVSTFLLERPDLRYLEARITPKDSAPELARAIGRFNDSIRGAQGSVGSLPFVPANCPKERLDCRYIVHFIKKKIKSESKVEWLDVAPRDYALRRRVRRQALAIGALWQSVDARRTYVCGIDAANSEAACRPEAFGQAFRFLRNLRSDEIHCGFSGPRVPAQLGITYHVGEDFLDIVDGLRAIEEACIFLDLRSPDRLGHALALGVDVAGFYESIRGKVFLPQQMLLDNIVWLYHKARKCRIAAVSDIEYEIEQLYGELLRTIYGAGTGATLHDYYLSWLLRGDDPNAYSSAGSRLAPGVLHWDRYALCRKSEYKTLLEQARSNERAVGLYRRYHFDRDVKRRGACSEEFFAGPHFIGVVAEVQRHMLGEIERKGLCIECNPTSNVRIRRIGRYQDHPLKRFCTPGYSTEELRSIPISIDTDDLGVFDTSIEREYSLIAWAHEKENRKRAEAERVAPQKIYRWLDSIREMAFEQRFVDTDSSPVPLGPDPCLTCIWGRGCPRR